MTNSSSQHRPMPGQSLSRDRSQSIPTVGAKPLPAAEIEALLKLARENSSRMPTNAQVEEPGPGDVQYLRGESVARTDANISAVLEQVWPETFRNPEAELADVEQQLTQAIGSASPAKPATVPLPDLSHVSDARTTEGNGLQLEDLGDVELDISIELGRTEILIEDVLKLREGSVVSLDKLAGDPVDIVANGRLVARGELLVIDGKFGVRLSEVL